jgi:hypothetical protein
MSALAEGKAAETVPAGVLMKARHGWLAFLVMLTFLAATAFAPHSSAQIGGMGGGMGGMGGGRGGMGGGMGGMGGMGGGMGGMGGGGMGGMGGGGMGGMGGGMGGMGGGGNSPAGVLIDPQGVLRVKLVSEADGVLAMQRRQAVASAMPADLRKASSLRKVALSRLEEELARQIEAGHGLSDDLTHLAGLQKIQYVLIYPEIGEIVLAGPAEGWAADAWGRAVGLTSGRPVVLLEDLAAAMRAFPPGHPSETAIGCSIDPTQEGLAGLQNFLNRLGRVNPAASVDQILGGMRQSLGYQEVRVDGVPASTHFAQVMVEADYRMKLIGIGLEPAPVPMRTWVELSSGGSGNALQRWYFVPDYECIRESEDGLAIELVGQGVKLANANEVVQRDGSRVSSDRPDRASELYTLAFTRKYPQIAEASPVYAQLRTLVDLAVVAAYLQEHDAYGRVLWGAELLLDEGSYAIQNYAVPTHVEPAVNAIWRGRRLSTPIGGGVVMQPRLALDSPNILLDEKGSVAGVHGAVSELPEGRWWWD